MHEYNFLFYNNNNLKTQVIFMQFSKAQKVLHDTNNFNPPPGYYLYQESKNNKPGSIANTNFAKQERFNGKQLGTNPGPGYYHNDKAERVRKRIIQQAKRKQSQYKANSGAESQIKISSIPSIPKKSTTRVYEELAPGILILHEQENEGINIGPGSYNINNDVILKKPIAHKINPEHKKKIEPQEPQIKIPTIAQEIRNQKRQLYKRNLIKTTGLSKNMISPSDLCLEVIILREKLLRSEENPPPGYYYNEKYQSSFKQPDPDLLPQYQLMMGKQARFKQTQDEDEIPVGPGAYEIQSVQKFKKMGGFIPKGERELGSEKKPVLGPGAYKVQSIKAEPTNPKGNYPPIFGSGNSRFNHYNSSISQTPGPGSYKVQKPRAKKQKYLKIKKNFYESQVVKPQIEEKKDLISLSGDKSRSVETTGFKQKSHQKTNHYFSSKVERFAAYDKNGEVVVGPGNYEIDMSSLMKQSFNRHQEYTGSKQPRFDDTKVRPNLGPGAYFTNTNDPKHIQH